MIKAVSKFSDSAESLKTHRDMDRTCIRLTKHVRFNIFQIHFFFETSLETAFFFETSIFIQ